MLIIRSSPDMARALDLPIDPALDRLLRLRRDQLTECSDYDLGELARFVIVEPGDQIEAIEALAGFPLFTKPAFEWVQDYGGWLEGVVILSDDGFGIALFVPDAEGVDPKMLSILRDQAARSTSSES